MRMELPEFRSKLAGGRRKLSRRTFSQTFSSRARAATCNAEMLDEAFAVYSRVDAGETTRQSIEAESSADGREEFNSAARKLTASISAQLESLDRQRRELEQLLKAAESSAS